MAARKSTSSPASKLVASLEVKAKKLQTQISQARIKAIADAKKALASANKASQKGKKNLASLNAKLKASSTTLKKAKTTAAKASAKKRVSAAKSALAKQKTLMGKLAGDLGSAKNTLIQATKAKKNADALMKATAKATKDLEKTNKKKPVKRVKSAPKAKAPKVKTAPVKRPTKKAKVAVKQPKQNQAPDQTPSMDPVPVAAKEEPRANETAAPIPNPQLVEQADFSPSSSIEENKSEEASPYSKASGSLFGSED